MSANENGPLEVVFCRPDCDDETDEVKIIRCLDNVGKRQGLPRAAKKCFELTPSQVLKLRRRVSKTKIVVSENTDSSAKMETTALQPETQDCVLQTTQDQDSDVNKRALLLARHVYCNWRYWENFVTPFRAEETLRSEMRELDNLRLRVQLGVATSNEKATDLARTFLKLRLQILQERAKQEFFYQNLFNQFVDSESRV